ncbi:UDP-3-O-(3-hydroxymyristoyl)glucosamine N-acyltransferase, partial [bacterium]|nr:UDP-3-O-(3-hydroxymyristoyl)glucosamine N-acyltransferase [bacterium]
MEATLEQLAALTGGALRGDASTLITGISGIQHAQPGEIAFITGNRFHKFLATTRAAALIVDEQFDPDATALPLLVAADPEAAFETAASRLVPADPPPPRGIHPAAVVADDAAVDPAASFVPLAVVES